MTANHADHQPPYAVPEGIVNAAIDAAYREFCRRLGHWDPQMPGQRDALRSALRHAWELSSNLIEAAVLRSLRDDIELQRQAASTAVVRHDEGSNERLMAATQLVTLTSVISTLTALIEDRDPFRLVEQ